MPSHFPRSRWVLLLAAALMFVSAAPVLPLLAQGNCSPLITIDSPMANATLEAGTEFAGWAVDQNAASGSGITAIQVVADGLLGAGGTVLGSDTQVPRPDVDAALHRTGTYGFIVPTDLSNLTPGPHTFNVYATTACGPSYASVAATVLPALFSVDVPKPDTTVSNGQTVDIGGWTAGSRVDVYLDGPAGEGQGVGSTIVNGPRPDVAQITGRQDLANSGFDVQWQVNNLTNGNHTLYVYSLTNGNWIYKMVPIVGAGGTTSPAATSSTPLPTSAPGAAGIGLVQILAPPDGVTLSGPVLVIGDAVDCASGTPALQVRLYRGGPNGVLLGNATPSTTTLSLAGLCSSGASGQAAIGWTFPLDTTQLPNGPSQITAIADVSGGSVQSSVTYTIANGPSTATCNPTFPLPNPANPPNVPCTPGPTTPGTAPTSGPALTPTGVPTLPTQLTPPSVQVLKNPTGATVTIQPGQPNCASSHEGPCQVPVAAGTCPSPGPCTIRFTWTEPVPAENTLRYGVGGPGSPFSGTCALPPSTTATCDAMFSAPAGSTVHYQAISTIAGVTVQTPDT